MSERAQQFNPDISGTGSSLAYFFHRVVISIFTQYDQNLELGSWEKREFGIWSAAR